MPEKEGLFPSLLFIGSLLPASENEIDDRTDDPDNNDKQYPDQLIIAGNILPPVKVDNGDEKQHYLHDQQRYQVRQGVF